MPTSSSSAHPQDNDTRKTKSQHVLQGSSAAGARALGTQLVAFYFRAPVKAFFRMRVDYMVPPSLLPSRVPLKPR